MSVPHGPRPGWAESRQFSVREIARLFDIPPWVVSREIPRPCFSWLRWKLRRVWKV